MNVVRAVSVLSLFLTLPGPGWGQAPPSGHWRGVIQGEGLHLVLHISGTSGHYTATADSPDQYVTGIPATVTAQGTNITIKVAAPSPFSFTGTLSGGTIAGTWSQGGHTGALTLLSFVPARPRPQHAAVTTGAANPALRSFDDLMERFMAERHVPGGALAVVKDGRLVYARGYGWADARRRVPARPDALFRIASLSKMITAAAVMTLVGRGRLKLDAPAFPILHLTPHLKPGTSMDPRLRRVTVRQLLQHTGGFDRDKSFDPMFRPAEIAKAVGVPAPANQDAIIRYMMGRPLDFDPGTRFAYSNFGYCVLGRIIEHVSGLSYGAYVQRYVLRPMGITGMRLGRTVLAEAAPREVHYYQPNEPEVPSVYRASRPGRVPVPYGGFDLEAMDSHGGWLASAVDLARFATKLDRLLPPPLSAQLYARPKSPVGYEADGRPSAAYYGFGWEVRPIGTSGAMNRWHNGSLPGTFTLLVRRWDGLSWVALFNQRSEGTMPPDMNLDPGFHRAADAVKSWPRSDLFPRFRRREERPPRSFPGRPARAGAALCRAADRSALVTTTSGHVAAHAKDSDRSLGSDLVPVAASLHQPPVAFPVPGIWIRHRSAESIKNAPFRWSEEWAKSAWDEMT